VGKQLDDFEGMIDVSVVHVAEANPARGDSAILLGRRLPLAVIPGGFAP
jgi:hypothetical protein